ncbi:MAG: hypothetical protein V1738_02985 [Patescibacteria group bacterium]
MSKLLRWSICALLSLVIWPADSNAQSRSEGDPFAEELQLEIERFWWFDAAVGPPRTIAVFNLGEHQLELRYASFGRISYEQPERVYVGVNLRRTDRTAIGLGVLAFSDWQRLPEPVIMISLTMDLLSTIVRLDFSNERPEPQIFLVLNLDYLWQ